MTDDTHATTTRHATRRGFLATSALAAASTVVPRTAGAGVHDDFIYEITRSDADWRERLTEDEYRILRRGGTELPGSSPLWTETRPGDFCCKGCDLLIYRGAWREPVEKGWVFFRHSEKDTVLTGIDGPVAEYGMDTLSDISLIEAHCRRCGSHLGHVLLVDRKVLHCINGASLTFTAR